MSTTQPVTSSAAPNATTTNLSNSGAILGKDDFLKLLVAQMKNQDPMSPQDNTQSIAQMAQFSSLEQMTNLVHSFDQLGQSMAVERGVSFIGKSVSYVAANGSTQQGVVQSVDLSGDAPTLTIDGASGIDIAAVTQVS
jgi:flagellar basal-body rod modification protein FlgD